MPRFSLAALSALTAVVFGWAAVVLPWGEWTLFSILTAMVAVLHTVTAVLAAAGRSERGAAWRWQSMAAIFYLLYCTVNVVSAGAHIAVLYGSLGQGLAAGLAACLAVVALLTVPLSVWGIAATGGIVRKRRAGEGAAALALLVGLGLASSARAGRSTPTPAGRQELGSAMEQIAEAVTAPDQRGQSRVSRSLFAKTFAECARPPADVPWTLLMTHRMAAGKDSEVESACLQGESLDALREAVTRQSRKALRGPIKFDLVTGTDELKPVLPLVDAMLVRPGLDGVCLRNRCVAPWLLVANKEFTTHTPLPFIPELRFGIDPGSLRTLLGDDFAELGGVDGLTRIQTRSFVLDASNRLTMLRRGRMEPAPLDAERWAQATTAAEQHIVAAQEEDGRFRYMLNPHTGNVSMRGFSIARQAGTTLVLCELGQKRPAVESAIRSSLEMLATLERQAGELGALDYPPEQERENLDLGPTALSLIAYLSCRDRVGSDFDEQIARMSRFILAMQRERGGFFPTMKLAAGTPNPGPDPLYAGGQAVFALVLLEKLALEDESWTGPTAAQAGEAAGRAMDYFANEYWPGFARGLFFVEENWHCLTARAALAHHRNHDYERFCLDYVEFKSRLILDEESNVDPTLVGGYGLGNVLLPHNTGAAGFGEALAAAMALRVARGEERDVDRQTMGRVLRFLMTQQWREETCFGCAADVRVVGGFSEHIGAPLIRIDYVQHAWAAMGHGGAFLFPAP